MFDSVLRRETLPKRRFGSGALLGIFVYAGVAAFAVWAQTGGKKHDKQDVAVTFVKPPPPPPPPPPAAPRQARPKPKPNQPQTVLQQAIVAPTVVPQEKPPEQEPVDSTQGVEGGLQGGEVGGVPGGIVGGVVDSSAVRMEFDERMTHPELLSGPQPQYTDKALEREVQGTMVVKCAVTTDGRVHDCRVLKSLPFMDRAVIEALERRRYKPATLGGRAVEVNYNFRITLKLPD